MKTIYKLERFGLFVSMPMATSKNEKSNDNKIKKTT